MACSVDTVANNIIYKTLFTWTINPFFEKASPFASAYCFKSPEILTWWHDIIQINLNLQKTYNDSFSGKFNIILNSKKGVSIIGTRSFHVTFKNAKSETVLYSGINLTSNDTASFSWTNYAVLKLHIEVTLTTEVSGVHYSPVTHEFRRNLASVKEKECLSDVIIHTNKHHVKANKVVLAAISPVFEAMFEHDCLEKKTNVIEMNDTDLNTVENFVNFAYTFEMPSPINVDVARKLYCMADKYQVDVLKKECTNYILRCIKTDGNALDDLLQNMFIG